MGYWRDRRSLAGSWGRLVGMKHFRRLRGLLSVVLLPLFTPACVTRKELGQ